jgi:hypothetical protein
MDMLEALFRDVVAIENEDGMAKIFHRHHGVKLLESGGNVQALER